MRSSLTNITAGIVTAACPILIICSCPGVSNAQNSDAGNKATRDSFFNFTVDRSVPNSPAYTLLGLTPSNSRVSNPSALGSDLLNAFDRYGNLQVGSTLDFVPYQLFFAKRLTKEQYRGDKVNKIDLEKDGEPVNGIQLYKLGKGNTMQRFLSNLQVSLATAKASADINGDSTKAVQGAWGVYFTIFDNGDPLLFKTKIKTHDVAGKESERRVNYLEYYEAQAASNIDSKKAQDDLAAMISSGLAQIPVEYEKMISKPEDRFQYRRWAMVNAVKGMVESAKDDQAKKNAAHIIPDIENFPVLTAIPVIDKDHPDTVQPFLEKFASYWNSLTPEQRGQVDKAIADEDKAPTTVKKNHFDAYFKAFKEAKDKEANLAANESSWAFAFGSAGQSTDGSWGQFKNNGGGGWTALALKLSDQSQFVLSGRYRNHELIADPDNKGKFLRKDSQFGGGRLKFGSNDLAVSLEGTWVHEKPTGKSGQQYWDTLVGLEKHIGTGQYLQLSVGGESGHKGGKSGILLLSTFKWNFAANPDLLPPPQTPNSTQ